MDLITIFFTSIGSIIALFILTKLIGNRQMSQLSMFDYVNGITIGSIAAEMATSLESDFLKPLLAMIIYAAAAILMSYICCKSIQFRRIITGKSLILLDNGKLYIENLSCAKLDMHEFLIQCRNAGYFDLNNIQTAILEANGKISFLPISNQRPATPNDLKVQVEQEKMVANVIIDGNIMLENLKYIGNNEEWLKKQLAVQKIKKISDISLATCDSNNKLTIYEKLNFKMNRDILN
ncbi:MAG: DUF421 domain-containing protein [Oscillospiraceae bacterium]